MAGHSKWANIKHRKGAADAKRGKIFSKIAKEITVAARVGGGDPAANITLRALIQKARSNNMPADNIERAVKKGTGELDKDVVFEEIVYEGYANGGVPLMIVVLTDNKNRSASEVRHAFTKAGANLGSQGSVSRSFHRKGLILIPTSVIGEEELMDLVLENGAEDLVTEDETYTVTTPPSDFMTVVDALNAKEIEIQNSEVTMLPDNHTEVTELKQAKSVMKFIEKLEDLDDVQNVYHNMHVNDDIMAALAEED